MKNLLKYKEFLNENNDGMSFEPEEDDCVISSNGWEYSVSCGGQFQNKFDEMSDALKCVTDWQDENEFFPDIWYISDHGFSTIIDRDGKMLNSDEDEDEDYTSSRELKEF